MLRMSILAICLVLVASGCATVDTEKYDNRLDTLDRRVSSIEQKQDVLESEIESKPRSSGYVTKTAPAPTSSYKQSSASRYGRMSKKEIQKALRNAGYYYGPIDGKIGTKSKKAIREFQQDNGLKVDGIAGTQTQKALKPYLSAKPVSIK